jgi:flagellar basal body-associated protein FliL
VDFNFFPHTFCRGVNRKNLLLLLLLVVVVVVVVVLILVFTTFIQGNYNYLPETNDVSKLCTSASVL